MRIFLKDRIVHPRKYSSQHHFRVKARLEGELETDVSVGSINIDRNVVTIFFTTKEEPHYFSKVVCTIEEYIEYFYG